MEKIDELFENEINGVIHSYPSIYTKDDVASLLTKLRTNILGSFVTEQLNTPSAGAYYDINAINRAVADIIDNIDFDEYITSEPDLCGSYGSSFTLELNTSFDAYQFSRQMETELTDYFNDLNKE